MRNYFIKTPNFIWCIYPKLVWSFSLQSNKKKEIYLTFDDGPTPKITEWTLKLLKQYDAKATFFCIGKNIANHPDIFQQIINEGHSIGNHTHNHLNGWRTDSESYIENVLYTEEIIKSQIQNSKQPTTNNQQLPTKLFRPPYGKIKRAQSKQLIKLGYNIIMWDVLSADFDQSISEEKCLKNVVSNAKNGSIIIFHDSLKAEKNIKYVLPKVLEHFRNKGFEFKAIENKSNRDILTSKYSE